MTPRRTISLAALTVLELDPEQQVRVAAEAGFDAVGIRLVPATPEEPQRDTLGQTPLIRRTKFALEETGLFVTDVEILRLKPETRVREDFAVFFETAAYLGARNALIAGNDADHNRQADNYAELCEVAAEYGITPNLEPMPWTEIKNIAEAMFCIERAVTRGGVAATNAAILLDAIHFDRSTSTVEDLRSLDEKWLRYAQLCDAPAEKPTELAELLHQGRAHRYPPGQGGLDLVSFLNALPADLPLSIEAPVVATAHLPAIDRARTALQATRDLLARPDVTGR